MFFLPLCILHSESCILHYSERSVPNGYVHQIRYADRILCGHAGHRLLLPDPFHRRQRLRAGWTERGPLAHGLRLRHQLLLRSGLRGLCGTVRLEVRHRLHLGGHRQCADRLPDGLGHPGPTDQSHDPAPGQRHHAPVLRIPFRQQESEAHLLCHHLYFPDPLHRIPLQRPQPPLRHGL